MEMPTVPIAVVTGTIGVGKSTVAAAMSELLHERSIRHALIEVDSLGEVYPAPDPKDPYSNDLAMTILEHIWPVYLGARITRAVVTMTLENQQELEDLLTAMDSPPATVVRLTASEETRRQRIQAREFGNLRELFLEKTSEIEWKMDCFNLGDLTILNDERHPHETALEVLEQLKWLPV